MTNFSKLTDLANLCGLEVGSYNPGDNMTYKVYPAGQGLRYFSTDGLFRSHSRAEVIAFIRGYAAGRGMKYLDT